MVTEKLLSPSSSKSSFPTTVTFWGVSQFSGVKVRRDERRSPSVESETESPMVTLLLGADKRTALNFALSPSSLVVRPVVG